MHALKATLYLILLTDGRYILKEFQCMDFICYCIIFNYFFYFGGRSN